MTNSVEPPKPGHTYTLMVQSGWQQIETLPEGEHVLLYWPDGERGIGGMETATVFRDSDGTFDYWTHGGPNSGSDWEVKDNERPTHWMPLPEPPIISGK